MKKTILLKSILKKRGISMKNKKIFTTIFALLFLSTNITFGINLTKEEIQNIIGNDAIEVKSTHEKKDCFFMTQLKFYYNDIFLGTSKYQFVEKKLNVYLSSLEVKKEYRGSGIGEQLFYKTMREIHKQYPKIEIIWWMIYPDDIPKNVSLEEGYQLLYKFYRRVGATVNNFLNSGEINLKEAGYFDE